MAKLYDFQSTEKQVLIEKFQTMPLMDNWLANYIENFIYENIVFIDEYGHTLYYKTRYGQIHGNYKSYRPNETLYMECEYKDGQLNGKLTVYHVGGNISYTKYYINGIQEGMDAIYFSSGILSRLCYYKNDKMNGPYSLYRPDGKLWIERIYKDDTIVSEKEYS